MKHTFLDISSLHNCIVLCFDFVFLEKVHFQHTAKFIAQLISERANYTLQVSYPSQPTTAKQHNTSNALPQL